MPSKDRICATNEIIDPHNTERPIWVENSAVIIVIGTNAPINGK